MLKNMSVGKKFVFSFGIVIALIAVILAVTIVTSLSRTKDLDRVDVMSDLQRAANNLYDEVNTARIELRTVFTSSDADEEYEKAIASLNAAESYLSDMDTYANELGDQEYIDANTQLKTLIPEVIEYVTKVHENDNTVNADIEIMSTRSKEAFEAADSLVELANNNIQQMSVSNSSAVPGYLTEAFFPIMQLSSDIDEMRIQGSYLILAQDQTTIDTLYSMIDAVDVSIDPVYNGVTTAAGITALDNLETAIDAYRDAVDDLSVILADTDSLVATARGKLDELAGVVDTGVEMIDTEVNSLIENTEASSTQTMYFLSAIVLLAIVFSFIIATVLRKMITRPIHLMHEVMVQAGTIGDLNFSDEVRDNVLKEAESKDEIGQSLAAFAGFIDRIRYIANELEVIASGDLTHEITKLSDRDTLGNSLEYMDNQLNEVFTEINTVAEQVSVGATQIADGAQSLAQGATEQASTVEEISASITEINNQANESAATAERVAAESQNIGNIAEEGGQRMASLMEAVEQINSASQSIGQVIKAIDDIAFQTNILALNAAVEAARAGQHGKGFAVVADEVRSLAGKSAEAASETSQLISDNIEKAELGLTIAQSTSESLSNIVEAVRGSVDSIQLIAEQSQGSQMATAQVSTAVSQVAQVVQTNSAASEESAAASEEMSGQADSLRELVARFKLKGQSKRAQRVQQKVAAPATVEVTSTAASDPDDNSFVEVPDDIDNKYF